MAAVYLFHRANTCKARIPYIRKNLKLET